MVFNPPPPVQQPQEVPDFSLAGYIAMLSAIRSPKGFLTTAPTFIPKTFLDQIQFYDDGANRRIYFYVNKVWRFSILT